MYFYLLHVSHLRGTTNSHLLHPKSQKKEIEKIEILVKENLFYLLLLILNFLRLNIYKNEIKKLLSTHLVTFK